MKLHDLIDRLIVMQHKYGNAEVVVLDPTIEAHDETSVWTADFKIGHADATTNHGSQASVLTIVPRPDLLAMDSALRKSFDDA